MIELENFRISIVGDSSCLDQYTNRYDCLWLLRILLDFASTGQMEFNYNFQLPYDYDIHVEEEQDNINFSMPALSSTRLNNLQSLKTYSAEIAAFEPSPHEMSNKKLRIWAPLRDPEPFDLVGVVQVATFLIVILLFGILFFTRYKVRNPGRLRSVV
jgi:hypothetical protein